MVDPFFEFRRLFESIDSSPNLFGRILGPWLDQYPGERAWPAEFADQSRFVPGSIPAATRDDLENLYALSRVNQRLLLAFQPYRDAPGKICSAKPGSWMPQISVSEYVGFMEALGMLIVDAPRFHPFYHEIVEIEPAPEPDAPLELIAQFWPALMLGDLMFSRSGVLATAGVNRVVGSIAETSTLYWAHCRRDRPHQDLSHGWGHNSQWRTKFRRDYLLDGVYHFNADGGIPVEKSRDPEDAQAALTPAERKELLVHRAFVQCAKRHDDLFPYFDTHRMRADE